MRKAIVAGNWKMHKTASEAVELVAALKPLLEGVAVEAAVCPPFTSLQAVHAALEGSAIGLGAQNMHWAADGAHTGEISAAMLLASGGAYVILGHSERRQAGESDEMVHRKLVAALDAGLRPIVCVGETLEEREAGRIEEVVLGQVGGALGDAGVEPHAVRRRAADGPPAARAVHLPRRPALPEVARQELEARHCRPLYPLAVSRYRRAQDLEQLVHNIAQRLW